ncbi:cytochrome c [Roseovarius sp. M141]|uniref:c-type cytochrome n=1 Tax=Roseovarius sp. M141 TaxID=2583806 RepID=UPI0020CC519A|nr:cytochrome c [Roseovarius sp. M141]MCQ0092988.1 cytochrome c [Roseovarius sp. M141]
MKWGMISLAVIAAVAGAWYVMQPDEMSMSTEARNASPLPGDAMVAVTVPASLSEQEEIGKRAYDAVCASCHGENAQGKEGTAPPLVHKIYEPSHHADMAFVLAAQNGVRAHHWKFGNMPPVKGVTQADVLNIIAYVRVLQRENGIN